MDRYYVYCTAALIVLTIGSQVFRKSFDPFAPIWLFLVGYIQVYVIQAISYRDYSIKIRGIDLVTAGNQRALWALAWFLCVYYSPLGRIFARKAPSAPENWSKPLVLGVSPLLITWGLFCSGVALSGGADEQTMISQEENLLRQFPMVLLLAGNMLIVTGRRSNPSNRFLVTSGIAIAALYSLLWMMNGKRSHSLFAVLSGVCSYYISKGKKPSFAVLFATSVAGALVVTVAIGWRGNNQYEHNLSGFVEYVSEFDPSKVLENINVKEKDGVDEADPAKTSKETEEYCGFLLMLDTVPMKSAYDYGSSYIRIFSTYIPRIVWQDKPYFGREEWVNAWIAGSEFHRDETFTGPAIGILGATQLNGGAIGTAVVLACIAILIRSAYEYYRLHAHTPWAQVFWAMTYYNAWLMVVNDDPFVWFYYVYGFALLPPLTFFWIVNKFFYRDSVDPNASY